MNKLNIIYKDEYVIGIDKPAGVIVNRADTHSQTTVEDMVQAESLIAERVEEDPSLFTEEAPIEEVKNPKQEFFNRSGIVHRLDKDTSGVLLVARTQEAFYALQQQFKERTVKKHYIGMVFGVTPEGAFEIDAPLDRNPTNRLKMAVVKEGRPAVTRFETLSKIELDGQMFSTLAIFPESGRTHQIRVHLTALKNPIAGDPIYCSKKQFLESEIVANRMMLHALSIRFTHPLENKLVDIKTEIPSEFSKYF